MTTPVSVTINHYRRRRHLRQPSAESLVEAELEPRGIFLTHCFLDYTKLPPFLQFFLYQAMQLSSQISNKIST